MRLGKNDVVCGLPAQEARNVMRLFRQPGPQHLLHQWSNDVGDLARLLEAEGWLQYRGVDPEGEPWWETTIRGNALAQASFRRPISRATAERHLQAVVTRAEEYNACADYLFDIVQVIVFGSYLNPGASELGDLDLAIVTRDRIEAGDRAKRSLDYAVASGRRFNTYFDKLAWAEVELVQILRNRVSAISITREDISKFADRWKVVYKLEQ